MPTLYQDFSKGIVKSNPVFVLAFGLCPTLAFSNTIDNALAMTGSVLFVLIFANPIVSMIRNFTPPRVRIAVFIVIIATLVTIVDLSLQAFQPELSKSLGIFIPLIVVNCIVLGRAEAFASKNSPLHSTADAFGMAMGFGVAILAIAFFRQVLGTGILEIFGKEIFVVPGLVDNPLSIFVLPMGAFFVIGILMATLRYLGVIKSE